MNRFLLLILIPLRVFSHGAPLLDGVPAQPESSLRPMWPWSDLCKTTRYPGECDVFTREDLPVFPNDSKYQVLMLSHNIEGNGNRATSFGAWIFNLHHSALGFKEVGSGYSEFRVGMYATMFGTNLITPGVQDGRLVWNDTAVLGWSAHIKSSEWTTQIPLGYVSGCMLNNFMHWLVQWQNSHPTYKLFSAWNKAELSAETKMLFSDTQCHTLTQDSISELVRLGARLGSEEVLCRNYLAFVANEEPKPVMSTGSLLNMVHYYGSVAHPLQHALESRDISEFASMALEELKEPIAFLHNGDVGIDYQVGLQFPFLGVLPSQLNQRMILPWQRIEDAVSGECSSWYRSQVGAESMV